MTTFALVRREPDDKITTALGAAFVHAGPEAAYKHALAASEPPTDAELDELCAMFWPGHWIWKPGAKEHVAAVPGYWEEQAKPMREQMRSFLSALTGQRP